MKPWTLSCLAAMSLLTACASSDKPAADVPGTGAAGAAGTDTAGAGGYGAGGAGGAGSAAPGSEEDLVRTAGDRIFFDTDSSRPNAQAATTLDKQVAWMQQYPQTSVWVAGNADQRGTEEYNLALGQRRAAADRDYLVAHGIERGRIETISYGKMRPIDPADTPQAWSQNRNAITSVK